MIEMSSAASPALASSGAVLATVPAETGAEGATKQDFCAVLADASAPALTTVIPDFAAIRPGKAGTTGNLAGKTLPVGKLPDNEAAITDDAPTADATIAPASLALAFLPPVLPATANTTGAVKTAAAQMLSQAPARAVGVQQALDVPAPDSQAKPDHAAHPAVDAAITQIAAIEHKAAPAAMAEATPTPRLDAVPTLVPTEVRTSAPAPATTAMAPSTPTQDISTLVDRIAEARAAAAPGTVRAALMHADFGAVSLRFRADDSHIQVTLGSADPGFAPAVHAAAAASQAGNAASDTDRRDQPTHQRADAQSHQPAQQQQPSHDRAAPDRVPARESAFNGPTPGKAKRDDTSSAPLRRSGIYA